MTRLKITLLFSITFILSIIYSFYIINNNVIKTKYKIDDKKVEGNIKYIGYKEGYISIEIDEVLIKYKGNEKFKVGDYITCYGTLNIPNSESNFNLFSYRNYLLSKKIYYVMDVDEIEVIKNNNFLYNIKNFFINRIEKSNNKKYLYTFILGDNSYIDKNVKNSYQTNGISHLFAVSGMHVSLLTMIMYFMLNKLLNNKIIINGLIVTMLLIYIFLTNGSPSIIRASFLFILCLLNKELNLKIDNYIILLFILAISLLYNPYYIYNSGFLFSYTISFFLIKFGSISNLFSRYFTKLLITSLISFVAGIPIMINNFFSINILTPIINLLFVPLISYIIFPLSLICLIIPKLDIILSILIKLLESLSLFISQFKIELVLKDLPLFMYLIYYVIIYFILYKVSLKKYKYIIYIIVIIIIHHNINFINNDTRIHMINVGQGDSILLVLPHNKNILIDCSNKIGFNNNDYDIGGNVIIPYIKSLGINKLDYLILTHGDYDHLGSSIKILDNLKVKNVILNSGNDNKSENNLIKYLIQNNINYKKVSKYNITIDNKKIYFINDKDKENENEDSLIIYMNINNYKMLFMGDAGIPSEEYILSNYNIKKIDILKVGHHGSNTSSSFNFINTIKPKYCLISVGKNNKFNHPNIETLNILKECNIYRTDINGTISINLNKNIIIKTLETKEE